MKKFNINQINISEIISKKYVISKDNFTFKDKNTSNSNINGTLIIIASVVCLGAFLYLKNKIS